MKKKLLRIILIIALLVIITGCKKEEDLPTYSPDIEYKSIYDGKQGNAGPLDGNTIVISFLASEKNNNWTDSSADKKAQKNILKRLKSSTEYLSKQAKKYGKILTFYYDWEKYPDLKYQAEFESDIVNNQNYQLQRSLIEKNLNTQALKNKYHADNIIYFFFINTSFKNTVKSWTITHNNCDHCDIEYSNIFIRTDGQFESASTFAHEMMHQFGAPDFYYANEYIPQNYVDYLTKNESKDLMFFVNFGNSIASKFTDLDAYYVGIAPRPAEADRWNLGKSEYEK